MIKKNDNDIYKVTVITTGFQEGTNSFRKGISVMRFIVSSIISS